MYGEHLSIPRRKIEKKREGEREREKKIRDSSSPKGDNLIKVFRLLALHASILLGNFLSQGAGMSKSNGNFLRPTHRLEHFPL